MAKKKLGLSDKTLIGMVLGALAGILIGPKVSAISVVGDIFLRLLRMGVVPLIFSNVVLAVAGMGDLKRLGKIGIKMLILFLATTLVAATVGLLSGLVIKPGMGFIMKDVGEVAEVAAPTISGTLLNFFPVNIIQSLAEGNMLQVISFALISGIAILLLDEEQKSRVLGFFATLSKFIMSVLRFVMGFTPYGVFVLMANTTGKYGLDVFGPLGKFVLTIYVGLLIHAFVIYGGLYLLGTGKNPLRFYKDISPVWTTSLATCSTAATLPVSMKTSEEVLGIKKDIVGFTIPIGGTMNMDGNGLWYGVVATFVMQVLGMQMSLSQMLIAILTGVLMTLGSPGIPGGIFVATTIFLTTLGLPIEFVGLLAGIFRIMDMGITTINVVGSIVVASVIDAGERKKEKALVNRVGGES